jgi:hypothetical protein
MTKRRETAALLRLVAGFLERLTDVEVRALLEGKASLHVESVPPFAHTRSKSKVRSADPTAIADALRQSRTREEATAVLTQEGVSRVVLEKLARRMDLPVLRSDSVDRLRQRIVESTIGFRINSEAIRGASSDKTPE